MAGFGFIVTKNTVSPAVTRLIQTAKPSQRKQILRSMGTTFMSITQGNFNKVGASYRPAPWPNKKDGSTATLKKSGLLSQSFHLTVTDDQAIVSNPTPYAAIHQFGGKTRPHVIEPKFKKALAFNGGVYAKVNHPGSNIPARPFFPVQNGKLTPAAEKLILAAGQRTFKKLNP
jgi:phage virion morphogenesis protein